jgi:hypothetical protein
MADEYQYTPVDWGDTPPPSWLPPEARRVLEVLGYLDRPRNALAAAVAGAQTPGLSASNEFWKGLKGKTDVSWGDVVGIPKATEKDDWPEYLAKTLLPLGMDMVADPLNLVPLVGPAAKAGQLGRVGLKAAKGYKEAAKVLGGSSLGKAFAHKPWGFTEEVAPVMDAVSRESAINSRDFNKMYGEVIDPLKRATIREQDDGMLRYRQALERPEIDPAMAGVDPEILDKLKEMTDYTQEMFRKRNEARVAVGLDPLEQVDEAGYNFMARYGKKLRATEKTPLTDRVMFDPGGKDPREIMRFYLPEGEDLITKPESRYLRPHGIELDPNSGWSQLVNGQRVPIDTGEASLQEIMHSGIAPKRSFVVNPADSLALEAREMQNNINFLNMIREGEGRFLWRGQDVHEAEIAAGQGGLRQIQVQGLDQFWAPPSVANYIENQASRLFDPNTSIGVIGDSARNLMRNTAPGRMLGEATTLFKRATLPLHPAYHLGNELSNIGLQYQSGMSPIDIIRSNTAALRTQLGHDPEILSGLTGNRLVEELGVRDALGGWYGSELQDNLARAVTPPVLGGALGETATQGIDAVRRMHDWGYKVGSHIEDNARIGAAIDWLRKNAPNFAAKSPAEQELLLDQAARFAKDALIDYGPGGMTPFETAVGKPAVPFYSWMRGITGQTLRTAIEHPERLARTGRFLDEFSDPLTEEQKALADPWIREAGPVMGLLGMKIPGSGGMPGMTQLARMIPQGNIEQMLGRPTDYAIGAVNPFLKMPFEVLGNKSYFKDRPIDRIASSPFLDPLMGNDYEKATSTLFGYQPPAAYDYLLSQVPGGRYVSEANLLGRGAGLWSDPYKAPETMGSAAVSYLTGQKTYPYDEAKFRRNREREWSRKNTDIRKDMQMAIGKGDFDAAAFYREMMMKHQADKGRQLHLEAM